MPVLIASNAKMTSKLLCFIWPVYDSEVLTALMCSLLSLALLNLRNLGLCTWPEKDLLLVFCCVGVKFVCLLYCMLVVLFSMEQ